MNFIITYIYPIYIYLPIVLLITYCLSEMIWSPKLTTHPSWVFTKSFFLLMGTSISYLALSMGDTDPNLHMPHIQNYFFLYVTVLFSILSGAYIFKLLRLTWAHEFNSALQKQKLPHLIIRLLTRTQKFLLDTHFVHVLAFICLLLVLVSLLIGQWAIALGL